MNNLTPQQRQWSAWGIVAVALTLIAIFLGVSFPVPPQPGDAPITQLGTTHFTDLSAEDITATDDLIVSDEASVTTLYVTGATTLGTSTVGPLDLNGGTLTIDADADTTLLASTDDVISLTLGAATGRLDILTGNLRIGDGAPGRPPNGEDLYVEGMSEFDGSAYFDGDLTLAADLKVSPVTAISVTAASIITPTGAYQPLTSAAAVTTSTTTPIAAGVTGQILILENQNASDVITIDGTGGTVECKADIGLAAGDTLMLIFDGVDWQCLSGYDNS